MVLKISRVNTARFLTVLLFACASTQALGALTQPLDKRVDAIGADAAGDGRFCNAKQDTKAMFRVIVSGCLVALIAYDALNFFLKICWIAILATVGVVPSSRR